MRSVMVFELSWTRTTCTPYVAGLDFASNGTTRDYHRGFGLLYILHAVMSSSVFLHQGRP